MTVPPTGMDHRLYPFSPLPSRPPLVWPESAQLAVSVVLYFEHWELCPSEHTYRDPRFKDINGYFAPDQFLYSLKEYGNRIGIFRILDLLDRHALKVTVAANSAACERYPSLVEAFQRRGYEFAGHGRSATQMMTSRMSPEEERACIAASLDTMARTIGERPSGWISQDFGESTHTPQLLAEAGLSYVMDWPNDDQPYAMTLARPFVSIPNQAEWDDVQFLWHRRIGGARYAQVMRAASERLYADGAGSGQFLGIGIHPWVLGTPHRFRYLEEAITHIAALPKIWPAQVRDVAGLVLQQSASQTTSASS